MEQSKEPSLETKEQGYIRRAKEMIIHPDLPIARAWVDGDVEGTSSQPIVVEGEEDRRRSGLLNGTIEGILRLAALKATHSETPPWMGADRHVALVVYDKDEAIREVASEIPRLDYAREWKESWPPILEYVPPQKELGMKVAFEVNSESKDRIIKLLKPETRFKIIPDPSADLHPLFKGKLAITVEV